MSHINFNFLSNNVKGMQSSKKCSKQFEYFKSKLKSSVLLFLQEIHSITDCEKKWKNEFGGDLHFYHDLPNFCRVLIAFYGIQDITVKKKLSNKKGRDLVLETRIDDFDFLLINICNANTEKEQTSVLNELTTILSNFGNIHNHNVILQVTLIYFLTLR